MILKNLLLTGLDHPVDIQIDGSRIRAVGATGANYVSVQHTDGLTLSFEDALVFPGLINSHDHLDFNLFPALGEQTYSNYTEWGKHIHEQYKEEIAKVLKVPALLREQWGIYKNLICGVTTVVNHGERLLLKERLITVHERYQFLHSVRFDKRWKKKLNHPLRLRDPVVVHTGEGSDDDAHHEVNQLIRWNLLGKKLIGVHGVAMSLAQSAKFKALVWCPESNFFLLNQTAAVAELKEATDILFGTDSTLTGHWNIWEHLRLARGTGGLTDMELYESLNVVPAKVWGTKSGLMLPGYDADLVIADSKGAQNDLDAFFAVDPKDILLVLQQGQVRLFDSRCLPQLPKEGFSKLYIGGVCKYVQGNVPGLMEKIRSYYPEAVFPFSAES